MKKLILSALVASIAFALVGCGSGSASEDSLKPKDLANPDAGTRPETGAGGEQGVSTAEAKL